MVNFGPRGWFGFRLDLAATVWSEVKAIIESSYRLAAPQKLVQVLDGEG